MIALSFILAKGGSTPLGSGLEYNLLNPSSSYGTSTQAVIGSGGPVVILATNASRQYATFAGPQSFWLTLGTKSALNATAERERGIFVATGTPYTINPNNLYIGTVTAMTAGTASSTISVTEK